MLRDSAASRPRMHLHGFENTPGAALYNLPPMLPDYADRSNKWPAVQTHARGGVSELVPKRLRLEALPPWDPAAPAPRGGLRRGRFPHRAPVGAAGTCRPRSMAAGCDETRSRAARPLGPPRRAFRALWLESACAAAGWRLGLVGRRRGDAERMRGVLASERDRTQSRKRFA